MSCALIKDVYNTVHAPANAPPARATRLERKAADGDQAVREPAEEFLKEKRGQRRINRVESRTHASLEAAEAAEPTADVATVYCEPAKLVTVSGLPL